MSKSLLTPSPCPPETTLQAKQSPGLTEIRLGRLDIPPQQEHSRRRSSRPFVHHHAPCVIPQHREILQSKHLTFVLLRVWLSARPYKIVADSWSATASPVTLAGSTMTDSVNRLKGFKNPRIGWQSNDAELEVSNIKHCFRMRSCERDARERQVCGSEHPESS